jgi:hypothetical protein
MNSTGYMGGLFESVCAAVHATGLGQFWLSCQIGFEHIHISFLHCLLKIYINSSTSTEYGL